jgi:hypothetical protein
MVTARGSESGLKYRLQRGSCGARARFRASRPEALPRQRVTLDGTKIKANAGGNTFRGREKIAAHLAAAREQVRVLNEQAENEEPLAKR